MAQTASAPQLKGTIPAARGRLFYGLTKKNSGLLFLRPSIENTDFLSENVPSGHLRKIAAKHRSAVRPASLKKKKKRHEKIFQTKPEQT
jgi:hypothetical protein